MIKKLGIGCGGLILLLILIGVVSGGSNTKPVDQAGSSPAVAIAPSTTASATGVPLKVNPATLAPTAKPTASPVVIRGTGQTATDAITLPAPISIGAFTHSGSRNFVVQVVRGTNQSLLINTIGSYSGTRPLTGSDPLRLQIEADGAWTVTITPIACCATSGAFSGHGDATSNQFNSASGATWDFANDGQRNFVVQLHCQGGDQLVQNRIGPFQGSAIINMPSGPCYWEVQSDGNWSLKPR